jgi:DUF971 family protein
MSNVELKPISIQRQGTGLAIRWSDGVDTHIEFAKLRKYCPCATCVEVRKKPEDPFKILSAQELAAGAPTPVAMHPRGYYAYQIVWNDGHDTGIYSLQLLRQLSESEPTSPN